MIKNTSLSMVKGLFQTYQSLHDPSAHNAPSENLVDLMTELMHLANCQSIDARAVHNIVLTHYLDQIAEAELAHCLDQTAEAEKETEI